jgi:hypothetical protein
LQPEAQTHIVTIAAIMTAAQMFHTVSCQVT